VKRSSEKGRGRPSSLPTARLRAGAVTRAAHTEEWRSWTTSEELERAAGELLYARVWNVQMPEGAQL